MKTKFTSHFIFRTSVIAALLLFLMNPEVRSQITITSNDMPSPNDTIRKSQALSASGIDYTISGPNHVWDFSPLDAITQTVDTFVTVNSVPFLYQLVFIPNIVANVAQKFSEIDTIPDLPIADPYRFFRKTSTTYNDVGYAITVSGIPVPLRLNPADVVYKLPLVYGNQDSSDASGQIGLAGFGYLSIQRKRVNHVDGWGSITTHYGTFDVLRLKSTVYENDSIFIDTLNFGTSIERTYIEYKWLTNGKKTPVLQITEEGPLVQVAFIDSILDPTVNVDQAAAPVHRISVAPNPFSDYAIVSLDLNLPSTANITLITLAGIQALKIFDGQLPAGRHFFAVDATGNHLTKGVYLLKVNTNGRESFEKIILQ